jgi:hypothetical protein
LATTRSRTAYVAVAAAACIIASIAGATARWHDGDEFTRPVAEAVVHYAPTENFEHIDVVLIDQARTSTDIVAYVPSQGLKCRLADDGVLQFDEPSLIPCDERNSTARGPRFGDITVTHKR